MPNHLTSIERDRIAELCLQHFTQKDIAQALGRSPGTISRELQRNRTGNKYYPAQAQRQSEQRRRDRPLVRKMDDPAISHAVRSGLAQDWSPEQIVGQMQALGTKATISHQTIYAWIARDDDRPHWQARLRRRGKRPIRRKNTAPRPESARIRNRPEIIEQRLRLGDFEGDTVLGPPGTGGLVTLVDRKSRLTIMAKIQSKDADHVHAKIKQRLKELDEEQRHSITFDNGTEFARCQRLVKHLDMQLYFADPGCPYQRGTNENTNGLIRQYFPKGTDFRNVSHAEVRRVEDLLNHRPRKCLNWRTPHQVSHGENPPTSCA